MNNTKIGITIGDVNGIGPEIIIKALSNPKLVERCTPIIYGSSKVLAYYKNIVKSHNFSFKNIKYPDQADRNRINVINISADDVKIEIGTATKESGAFALKSIEACVSDAQERKIDAIVTAPINKKSMEMAGFKDIGHTEYLSKAFNAPNSLMLMVAPELRVGTLTNHIPVKDIAESITRELILRKAKVFNESLKRDFGIDKPVIAILGLNPHAGDDGLIGQEENDIIRPTIIELKKNHGILASGPYSADGFFASGKYKKVDGVLASFHDQALIPFKILSGENGVNFTAGLPVVRTSPDHGTAYDLAGKDEANYHSFISSMYQAIDICRERKLHKEINANPLNKKDIKEESPDEKVEKIEDES